MPDSLVVTGVDGPEVLVEEAHDRRIDVTEIDGPMLRHGLQEMHRRPLTLPRQRSDRPDPQRLVLRFERFQTA